jgi:hypothetical protein
MDANLVSAAAIGLSAFVGDVSKNYVLPFVTQNPMLSRFARYTEPVLSGAAAAVTVPLGIIKPSFSNSSDITPAKMFGVGAVSSMAGDYLVQSWMTSAL